MMSVPFTASRRFDSGETDGTDRFWPYDLAVQLLLGPLGSANAIEKIRDRIEVFPFKPANVYVLSHTTCLRLYFSDGAPRLYQTGDLFHTSPV